MTPARPSTRDRGQVLPLFALFVVVLLAFAALAVDVSGALAARRYYRSVADAAALAGAQDLQQPDSRTVLASDRIRARQDAMASLTSELGIDTTATPLPPACSVATDADVMSACVLPGTTLTVSIRAGVYAGQPVAIACQDCDPARSVQVGLSNPGYQLTFARLFGQSTWNVGTASVAGLAFGKSYAIQTLRPPKKNGATFLVNDIEIDGGSVVNVQRGDVGTNANMNYSGTGSILNLDSGYGMYYFDPASVPGWIGPPAPPAQIVQKLPTLISDPNYTYPAMSGSLGTSSCSPAPGTNCAPTFTDAKPADCGATLTGGVGCTRADLDATTCKVEADYLKTSVYTFMATQPYNQVFCYRPGIYDTSNAKQLASNPGDVIVLLPGAYYFKSGLDIGSGSRLLGGYRPSVAGVALMFDECSTAQCSFSGNAATTISLNAGTKYPPGTSGVAAKAAVDWNDQLVQTSGPSSPTPPLLLTLLVLKDPTCYVPTSPPWQEPTSCDALHDKTLNVAGGGSLALEGVQYAPTDNVSINGGSVGTGQVGQIIAWTLTYTGGTQINQEGPPSQGPGTLRLDAACTAPGTPCNP